MKEFLYILTHPSYWSMIHPYSEVWDRKLQSLLETTRFTPINSYRARIGEQEVWIENFPYGAYSPIVKGVNLNLRAKRITIMKAHAKYISDVLEVAL